MVSAMDVANFFIKITRDSEDQMTNLRIQKYLYFAQGWSLIRFGRPLFKDKIEAWQLGPVVPDVYHEFSSYKNSPIKKPRGNYSREIFAKDELDLLMDVALEYYRYTTSGLVDFCHEDDGAWERTYDESASHKEIPVELIHEEFSKKEALQRLDIKSLIKKMKPIGYRNSEGYIVLPKELDDE